MNEVPDILLLWVDIETTGLDYENDIILEMAWQITDYLGEPLTEMQSYVTVDQDDESTLAAVLARYMKAVSYVKGMHRANGLWNEVLFGNGLTNPRDGFFEVVEIMLGDLETARGIGFDYEVRFAGSSVGFDKRFIETIYGGELPGVKHRIHDLSVFRPLFDWQGVPLDSFTKDFEGVEHRAADDIRRDIAQWRGVVKTLI